MSKPVPLTDLSPRDVQAVLQALLDVMGFDSRHRCVVLTRDGEARLLPIVIQLQD